MKRTFKRNHFRVGLPIECEIACNRYVGASLWIRADQQNIRRASTRILSDVNCGNCIRTKVFRDA